MDKSDTDKSESGQRREQHGELQRERTTRGEERDANLEAGRELARKQDKAAQTPEDEADLPQPGEKAGY